MRCDLFAQCIMCDTPLNTNYASDSVRYVPKCTCFDFIVNQRPVLASHWCNGEIGDLIEENRYVCNLIAIFRLFLLILYEFFKKGKLKAFREHHTSIKNITNF